MTIEMNSEESYGNCINTQRLYELYSRDWGGALKFLGPNRNEIMACQTI